MICERCGVTRDPAIIEACQQRGRAHDGWCTEAVLADDRARRLPSVQQQGGHASAGWAGTEAPLLLDRRT